MINTGTRVRYATDFLRSTAQFTGPEAPASYGPFARGTVKDFSQLGPHSNLAVVEWEDGITTRVLVDNLEPIVR